jgi:hypothetical protein
VKSIALGQPRPDMPLFLAVRWYINVLLETTYDGGVSRFAIRGE